MKSHGTFSITNILVKCKVCKKFTHSSIDGSVDINLCRKCYDEAGLENEHSDGYHDKEANENCPECKKAGIFYRVSTLKEDGEVKSTDYNNKDIAVYIIVKRSLNGEYSKLEILTNK